MNNLKYDEENQFHYNDDYVFFTKSFLSQWYGAFSGQESSFRTQIFGEIDVWFNCAEQAMMWSKAMLFSDYETAQQVLAEKHPKEQKNLGRMVQPFNQQLWDDKKFQLIVNINKCKFAANKHLRNRLLETTKTKMLVEAAPWDSVWGIGMGVDDPNILDQSKWRGENLLGKSLMKVRESIMINEYGVFS